MKTPKICNIELVLFEFLLRFHFFNHNQARLFGQSMTPKGEGGEAEGGVCAEAGGDCADDADGGDDDEADNAEAANAEGRSVGGGGAAAEAEGLGMGRRADEGRAGGGRGRGVGGVWVYGGGMSTNNSSRGGSSIK